MAAPRNYRDLDAWQAGITLVETVYIVSRTFPRDERFGLTAQLRRAALSIPSNIAEGACRRTTGAFVNHLRVALGSHGEVETCFEVAARLGYLPEVDLTQLMPVLDRAGQLLSGLLRSLLSKTYPP